MVAWTYLPGLRLSSCPDIRGTGEALFAFPVRSEPLIPRVGSASTLGTKIHWFDSDESRFRSPINLGQVVFNGDIGISLKVLPAL